MALAYLRLVILMEYRLDEYERAVGKVFTTSDGNKYILSKSNVNFVYLRCALFRGGCKGTSKLNRERDLITPLNSHNHDLGAYQTELFALKTKCKSVAKKSQMNLREVFDDVTRDDPRACEISFSECESMMFRARKTVEPRIPQTAFEFSDMITTTSFGKYYKFSVSVGNEIGVIFLSDQMNEFLSQVTNIQYDGTFFTVPIQFYQLWTILISVGRHTLPDDTLLINRQEPTTIPSYTGNHLTEYSSLPTSGLNVKLGSSLSKCI